MVLASRLVAPAEAGTQRLPVDAGDVVRLTVRTPHAGFNRMVVSITVCAPRTSRCATIDDVMVDTGSTGLRLEASAVPPWLRLPPFLGQGGKPLAECLRFLHDNAWGPLLRADLGLGGLTAADLPIQVIGEETEPLPERCPRSEVRPTSNGTLGIGPQLTDCRGSCEQSSVSPGVFECEAGRCTPIEGRVAPNDRLPNPITRFPGHDNGVVFDVPGAPPGGADEIVGTLTLGVDTGNSNQVGSAAVVRLDRGGRFTTLYRGASYPESYIDSGTETYIFADPSLARCSGMAWAYCASPDRQSEAVMIGQDGAKVSVPFRIGDYRAVRDRRFGASDSLAVAADPSSDAFVWGAPFFLGKRVYVVLDGKAGAGGLAGPFYAFSPNPSP